MAPFVFPNVDKLKKIKSGKFGNAVDKSKIPEVPKVLDDFEVYFGGNYLLGVCILQLLKAQDHKTVVRAMGSAVTSIMGGTMNYLGAKTDVVDFTGDELFDTQPDDAQMKAIAVCNFKEAQPFTNDEWVLTSALDQAEVAAYFGIMMKALVYCPPATAKLDAFNIKRSSSAKKAILGDAKIFIEGSKYITHEVIRSINAAFNFHPECRANLIKLVVDQLGPVVGGKKGMFLEMFEMIENQGLTPFAIVATAFEFAEPQMKRFPMLYKELEAVLKGVEAISSGTPKYIGYNKAMFQERFVPADPNAIRNIVAVAKVFASVFVPTYEGYEGGEAAPGLIAYAEELVKEMKGEAKPEEEKIEEPEAPVV
jgi:hypothetical protein